MRTILVKNLKKYYSVYQKEPGFLGSLKSFFLRKYSLVKAVDDISFTIKQGELVGFIGPNGAGKTTTLKCLAGLLYPTAGQVSVLGYVPFSRKRDFLKKIALVMGQKNQLWWDLPPMETFLLNKEIYEIPDDRFKQTLSYLSKLLEVEDVLGIQVRKLSLGQRMKCELIAVLIHNPQVLFLDEPTIGLDVVMQKKMRDFIKTYNEKFKSTIILTSHYMDDVKELCKRIIIIDQGRILYDGQLNKLVDKYAKYKIISIVFNDYVDPKRLLKMGEVKSFEYPKAVVRVVRAASNLAAAQILQEFPVADLNIEEPDIEDVIREVFAGRELS